MDLVNCVRRVARFVASPLNKCLIITASLAITLQPLTADLAMAQSISIDPTAPRGNQPGIGRSSTGKPTINIVTPKSGVSHNRYKSLSTNAGAIFNNSKSGGTTTTGGKVGGNTNLRKSGSARVIVNEVRGGNPSKVKGSLEVFGAKADVIIANPNGLTCDGCSFVNTRRATLSTGAVSVHRGNVNLRVKQGDVTVGRGGVSGADVVNLVGRHVVIDGKIQARDAITASGGAQIYNPGTGAARPAPSDKPRNAPYAVDSTAFGGMAAGSIRVVGNESGLGVRLDGKMAARNDLVVTSRGNMAIRNFDAGRDATLKAAGKVTQTKGTGRAGRNLNVSARRFETSPGAKLVAGNAVTIRTNETLTVGGEVRARRIDVSTTSTTTNIGKMISNEELTIVAGEIINRRSVKQTTKRVVDPANKWLAKYVPWIKWYVKRYPRGRYTKYYTYLLNSTYKTVKDQQTLGPVAVLAGRDVHLKATKGRVINEAYIAASNRLTVWARSDIVNQAQAERDRQSNGSYKTRYHWAAMKGANVSFYAGRNYVSSRASLGATNSLWINARNSLSVTRDYDLPGSLGLISRGGKVSNAYKIETNGSVRLSGAAGVKNANSIVAKGDIVLESSKGDIVNNSYLYAHRDLRMSARGDVSNFSAVARRNASVSSSGGSVVNRVRVVAYNALTINAGRDILNQGYQHGYSELRGNRAATLTAGANIRNVASLIRSYGDLTLRAGTRTAGSVINTGVGGKKAINGTRVIGAKYKTQTLIKGYKGGTWRAGHIQALGKGKLTIVAARGDIVNNGSLIESRGNLALAASGSLIQKNVDYSDDYYTATRKWKKKRFLFWSRWKNYDSAWTRTVNRRVAQGRIVAANALSLDTGGSIVLDHRIHAGTSLWARSKRGSVTNHKALFLNGNVALAAALDVVNTNRLMSRSNLSITAGRDIVNQGYASRYSDIYGARGVRMVAGRNLKNIGGRIWSWRNIDLIAGDKTGGSVIFAGIETRSKGNTVRTGQKYKTEWFTTIERGRWRQAYAKSHGKNYSLNIVARRGNVTSLGSDFRAAGNLRIAAAGDVVLNGKNYSDQRTVKTRQWKKKTWRFLWFKKTSWSHNDQVSKDRGTWRYANADVVAGGNIDITGRNVTGSGIWMRGKNVAISGRKDVSLTALRKLEAKGALRLTAANTARALGNVTAGTLGFGGTKTAVIGGRYSIGGSRDLRLGVWNDIVVEGTLSGNRDVHLSAFRGDIYNRGTIQAGRDVYLQAVMPSHVRLPRGYKTLNRIVSTGRVNAGRNAVLSATRGIAVKGVVAKSIDINSRWGGVTATGALLGRDAVRVSGRGNVQTRAVLANDISLESRKGSLIVGGWKASDGANWQTARGLYANRMANLSDGFLTEGDVGSRTQGVVYADNNLQISSKGKFVVSNGMTLAADNDLVIEAGGITVRSTFVPGTSSSSVASWLAALLGNTNSTTTAAKLHRSAILSGGDLTLNSTTGVLNHAGTISAKGNLYINAEGDIENRTLQTTFRLKKSHGCAGSACGKNGIRFVGAEMLSGAGMILSSQGRVVNEASQIAAAGSLLIQADWSIINKTRTGQYRIVDIYKKKCFIVCYSKTVRKENRAVIESGVIQTGYGDITLIADRGHIVNSGSFLSAGGDLSLQAGRDIAMNAISFEVHNLYKKRGFSGFLTYSSNKTYWNNFATALSQLEGMNVTVEAGRDVKGIGTTAMALNDLMISAGRDLSLDAKQNKKYLVEKGWSFGLTSSRFQVSQGLINSGDALQAYMNDNPAIAAVHELATAQDGWGALNGTMALIWHGSQTLANAGASAAGVTSLTDGLVQQFLPSDFQDLQNLMNSCNDVQSCAAAAGIGFRFEMWESRQEWTESHVSRLGAGRDLIMTAGRDVALVGGTIASAGQNVAINAGRDFLMTAVADNSRTRSSGWGVNVGFSPGGISVGGHANGAKSEQTIYTNAVLTAGSNMYLSTGRDAQLLGAVVKADNIYLNIGRDLVLASRQNTSSNSSWGFNVNVTVAGPSAGAFSIGGSYGKGSRAYTDTPTWLEAENVLDIFVGRTTYLMGAVMNSKSGELTLDTDSFIFDNYRDHEKQINLGGSIGFGQPDFQGLNGSFNASYANKTGVTYATVGGGVVQVRSNPDIDLSTLNTNVNTVHRTTKNVYINIKIPGINLQTLRDNLAAAGNFIRAATANIPDEIRNRGSGAVDLYQDLIASGASGPEAAAFVATDEAQTAIGMRENWYAALSHYGSESRIPDDVKKLILAGIDIGFDENGRPLGYIDCAPTSGATCAIYASAFNMDEEGAADIARQAITGLLNAYIEGGMLYNITTNPAIVARDLAHLLELYAYCADDFTGFGFLNTEQLAAIEGLINRSPSDLTASLLDNRALADRIDSDPAYSELQTAFAGLGQQGVAQYQNFLLDLFPLLDSGVSFTSANATGTVNDLFVFLQRSGDPDAMRAILSAMGENATDRQKFEMELSFEVAASFNTAVTTSEAILLLYGVRALADLPADIAAARAAFRRNPPPSGPVRIGEADTYGGSTNRAVVGDNLTGDHMPSRAALQQRIENEIGRQLTPAEVRQVRDLGGCVIVTGQGHCDMSNTYGGRNVPALIRSDSADLRGAADRDFNAMIPDLRQGGLSPVDIEAARLRLHQLNQEAIRQINEIYGTSIRY